MLRVAGSIFLFSVFLVLISSSRLASATEVNLWSSNVSSASVGTLTQQQTNNRYDCEYKNIKSVSLSSANTLIFKATTLLTGLTYTDQADKCIVTNSHGVFTSRNLTTTYGPIQTAEYFGKTTTKMYDLVPTTTPGQWIDPAPVGDTVLYLSKVSGSQEYYVNLYKNFSDGYPKLRSNQLTFDFTGTPNLLFKDKSGAPFKINRHAFSPNGRFMTISYNYTIAKIDLSTMKMTPIVFNTGATFITPAISNDGRFLAITGTDVTVYDSKDCAVSYDLGAWERVYASAQYAGCTNTNYPSTQLKNSGAVLPGSTFKRPHFGIDNKTLYAALSKGTSANDWTEIKLTANNQTTKTEGYLAMGDSFSSGEGDLFGGTWYEPGTDEQGNKDTFEGRNLCHVSRRSYPYLIAKELGFLSGNATEPTTPADSGLFHSVACSGAVVNNIIGKDGKLRLIPGNDDDFSISQNQFRNDYLSSLGRWQPGRIKQLDILDPSVFGGYSALEPKPGAITVGISGNDAGFGDTIKACTMPGTCKQAIAGSFDSSSLAIRIMKLKPKLVETYKAVKSASPESRVYVHGYPVFVKGYNGTCDSNVRLDAQETALVEQGVKYMNKIVQSAASEAGVFYIDIENILDGTNLCSGVTDGGRTVNGVTAGNDVDFDLCILRSGCLGKESFHPNQFAHKLYKDRVLQTSGNLTYSMPDAQKTNTPIPDSYFGSTAVNQAAIINNGGNYTIVVPEPKPFLNNNAGSYKINQSGLMPGSLLRVELQSTPTTLVEYTVPANGIIEKVITIPANVDSGFHELHLLGISNYGEQIDYYEPIIIAVSDTDFDGDGVLNADDSCPATYNVFVDIDIDGIDDVCDPSAVAPIVIVESPIAEDPPVDTPPEEPVEPPVEIIPEEQPPTEVINLDGRNLDKGQPNPETVAGDEELAQVLGATTADTTTKNDIQQVLGTTNTLEITGYAMILNIIVGTITISITILILRPRSD